MFLLCKQHFVGHSIILTILSATLASTTRRFGSQKHSNAIYTTQQTQTQSPTIERKRVRPRPNHIHSSQTQSKPQTQAHTPPHRSHRPGTLAHSSSTTIHPPSANGTNPPNCAIVRLIHTRVNPGQSCQTKVWTGHGFFASANQ